MLNCNMQAANVEKKKKQRKQTVCEAMLESMEGAEGRAVSRNVYLVHTYRGGYQKKCGRGGGGYFTGYRIG